MSESDIGTPSASQGDWPVLTPEPTPKTWAEWEAKCLAEDTHRGDDYEDGIRYAFAFIARHFPPASVCLAAGEMQAKLRERNSGGRG